MGLTYAQAKMLGIAHLHPAASGVPGREDVLCLAPGASAPAPSDGMNKLERRFRDDVLVPAKERHMIRSWRREPIKLRLAGRTWYTPDFVVDAGALRPDMWCVETKGYMKDDAAVKIKVAADIYNEYKFLLVYRTRRDGWRAYLVDGRGIGVNPAAIPWIGGG